MQISLLKCFLTFLSGFPSSYRAFYTSNLFYTLNPSIIVKTVKSTLFDKTWMENLAAYTIKYGGDLSD